MTWLMFWINEVCLKGVKYHDKKSDQHKKDTDEYVYHVRMMELYVEIMLITLKSSKVKEKYLKK